MPTPVPAPTPESRPRWRASLVINGLNRAYLRITANFERVRSKVEDKFCAWYRTFDSEVASCSVVGFEEIVDPGRRRQLEASRWQANIEIEASDNSRATAARDELSTASGVAEITEDIRVGLESDGMSDAIDAVGLTVEPEMSADSTGDGDSSSSSSDSNMIIYAAAGGGAVLVVALIAFVAMRRRKHPDRSFDLSVDSTNDGVSSQSVTFQGDMNKIKSHPKLYDDL